MSVIIKTSYPDVCSSRIYMSTANNLLFDESAYCMQVICMTKYVEL